ncbi:short-chain dehydrogenase/reductase SDR [Paractinoplanes abujensis]|uniref:3-oxoacyl-[acyl-carrier protein] reductase n=1 Tax=Paractinoplanes abujensis TaxID=882441 RepID=A0A7W7G210_9ACTN|nr:SDR family oxidoreductase [Actinoplanes abujensis]MBB4693262.1 3-oxoacyl-[acyl-carrier protein] reductase [Actinoplanes abujensis]GID24461.1 short-chain dehydrogenase/reductase SDR [Actinoplanes abujensis]
MPYATTRSLDGTVVAITGASAGIGAASVYSLVDAGARVAVSARREDRLAKIVSDLGEDKVVPVVGDVRDPGLNDALVKAAVDKWGRLDTMVANAGIGAYGGILDLDDDTLTEMVETNYLGTVWSVRSAVKQFRAQDGGGDIIVVSSVAGFRGGADEAVYAGTKHAQVGLAGSLDRELRAEGIRVTLICPAGTATEFAIGAGRTEGSPDLDAYLRPEDVAHTIRVVLEQPRSVRTTVWQLWSTEQQS